MRKIGDAQEKTQVKKLIDTHLKWAGVLEFIITYEVVIWVPGGIDVNFAPEQFHQWCTSDARLTDPRLTQPLEHVPKEIRKK